MHKRQQQIQRYGLNLKLGCLRLGDRFLYISSYEGEMRVFLFKKQQESKIYEIKFMAFEIATGNLYDTHTDCTEHRNYLHKHFRRHINYAMN